MAAASGCYADDVVGIGDTTFRDCSDWGYDKWTWTFTSVEIPSSITYVGDHAFDYCRGLSSIVLPDNVERLGAYVFSGSEGITSLTLGTGMKTISENAFYNMANLNDITVLATTPPAFEGDPFADEDSMHDYMYEYVVLTVPEGCSSLYRQADYWKNFQNIKEATAIAAVDADKPRIVIGEDGVKVEGEARQCRVCRTNGQLVYSGPSSFIPIDEPGVYILTIGNKSVVIAK